MSNRRLGAQQKTEKTKVVAPSVRESTYKQPTKGFKLTKTEADNLAKLTKTLRLDTGENVTDNKVVRALTYLVDDPKIVKALSAVIVKQLS